MKKRFSRWILYLWCRYIPSTRKVVHLEARRLSEFIAENYDFNQYTELLDHIRQNLLEHTKNEQIKRLDNISKNQDEMKIIANAMNNLDETKIIKSR